MWVSTDVHADLSLFPPSKHFHADMHLAELKLNTLTAKTAHKVLEPQGSVVKK